MLLFVLVVATAATKISVDFGFAPPVLGIAGCFFLLTIRYRRLGDDHLVAALEGSALLMLFSTGFMLATYLLPEHAPWGLWDAELVAIDEALGLTADDVVRWSRSNPKLDAWLAKLYYAFYYHYALIVLWAAAVRKDPHRAFTVLANLFTTGLLGLILFALFPALNAVNFYGHEDIFHTARLVEHLDQLVAGTFEHFSMSQAQGLVQFPSFHAALAVVLWWDLRHEHRAVFAIGSVWTALMLLSAVTTGGHYLVDVWGGALLAAGAIALVWWCSGVGKAGET